MKGKIFKIKNMEDELVLPITTTEAVYSEDGKTLNDEIDNINSSLDNIISKQYNNILDYGAKCVDGVDDSGVILKASEKGGVIDFSYLACFIDNNIVINNSNLTFINVNFTQLQVLSPNKFVNLQLSTKELLRHFISNKHFLSTF